MSRNRQITLIHVAKKTLGLDEDSYRALLIGAVGLDSLKSCTDDQLARVIRKMKEMGFTPTPSKGAAMHPMGRKARAMWVSLHKLGVIRNPSEQALEAFAKGQLKCDRLVWARQSDAEAVIGPLKRMAEEAGWRQKDDAGRPLSPDGLRASLATAIAAKAEKEGAL